MEYQTARSKGLHTLYDLCQATGIEYGRLKRWSDNGVIPQPSKPHRDTLYFGDAEFVALRRKILVWRKWLSKNPLPGSLPGSAREVE